MLGRLAVSTGLIVALGSFIDWREILRRLASADFSWFVVAVISGFIANLISAWRWRRIALTLGLRAPAQSIFLAYGRGVTLNTLLPGATLGGDTFRTLALHRLGNPLLSAAASVLLDRLAGLWALFVWSALAWLFLFVDTAPSALRASAWPHLLVLALAILAPFVVATLAARLSASRWRWLDRVARLSIETARCARTTFFSSTLVQFFSLAALAAALAAIGVKLSPPFLVALAAPVFLATALPVSVGGFGTREAALAAYFALADLPVEAAFAGGLLAGLAVTVQGALWAPTFLFADDVPR